MPTAHPEKDTKFSFEKFIYTRKSYCAGTGPYTTAPGRDQPANAVTDKFLIEKAMSKMVFEINHGSIL